MAPQRAGRLAYYGSVSGLASHSLARIQNGKFRFTGTKTNHHFVHPGEFGTLWLPIVGVPRTGLRGHQGVSVQNRRGEGGGT